MKCRYEKYWCHPHAKVTGQASAEATAGAGGADRPGPAQVQAIRNLHQAARRNNKPKPAARPKPQTRQAPSGTSTDSDSDAAPSKPTPPEIRRPRCKKDYGRHLSREEWLGSLTTQTRVAISLPGHDIVHGNLLEKMKGSFKVKLGHVDSRVIDFLKGLKRNVTAEEMYAAKARQAEARREEQGILTDEVVIKKEFVHPPVEGCDFHGRGREWLNYAEISFLGGGVAPIDGIRFRSYGIASEDIERCAGVPAGSPICYELIDEIIEIGHGEPDMITHMINVKRQGTWYRVDRY